MLQCVGLLFSVLSTTTDNTALSKDAHKRWFSRLDYCNAVLYGISDNLCQRLQSIQNVAGRQMTRRSRHEHITPGPTPSQACPLPLSSSTYCTVWQRRICELNVSTVSAGHQSLRSHELCHVTARSHCRSSGVQHAAQLRCVGERVVVC